MLNDVGNEYGTLNQNSLEKNHQELLMKDDVSRQFAVARTDVQT